MNAKAAGPDEPRTGRSTRTLFRNQEFPMIAQVLDPPEVAGKVAARVAELVVACDGLRADDRDDLMWDATRDVADLLGRTGADALGTVHWQVSGAASGHLDDAQPADIAAEAQDVAVSLLECLAVAA